MQRQDQGLAFFWILFAVMLLVVLVGYRAALGAWFAADDFLWLDISNPRNVLESFVGPWGHGAAYRPLTRVSFYLDSVLFGREASFWHAHSLLLHALGAALLAVLLDRLSGERAFAVLAALIFALLPLSYEATIWISGRMYVLCLPLALASALLFDRYLLAPSAPGLLVFVAALAITFLTYEGSVYVVPVVGLVALVRGRQGESRGAIAVGLAATAALALAYLRIRRAFVGPGDFLPTKSVLSRAFVDDLLSVAGVFLSQVGPARWPFVVAAALVAVTAPRMILIATFGGAIAAAGYAPFSFVTSFGMRYLYAAGVGLAIVLAAITVGAARVRWVGKPLAVVLLLLLLRGEWSGVTGAAREWAEAGGIARRTLASVARTIPRGAPGQVVVVFDVPLQHGRGMTFFTYFEIAMRLFHPEVGRLVIPTHYFLDLDEQSGWGSIGLLWQREVGRRAVAGLPPLACTEADPRQSLTRAAIARALLECKTTFVVLDPSQDDARQISREEARDRFVARLGPDADPARPRAQLTRPGNRA